MVVVFIVSAKGEQFVDFAHVLREIVLAAHLDVIGLVLEPLVEVMRAEADFRAFVDELEKRNIMDIIDAVAHDEYPHLDAVCQRGLGEFDNGVRVCMLGTRREQQP